MKNIIEKVREEEEDEDNEDVKYWTLVWIY